MIQSFLCYDGRRVKRTAFVIAPVALFLACRLFERRARLAFPSISTLDKF
jgi:hypothetical protein